MRSPRGLSGGWSAAACGRHSCSIHASVGSGSQQCQTRARVLFAERVVDPFSFFHVHSPVHFRESVSRRAIVLLVAVAGPFPQKPSRTTAVADKELRKGFALDSAARVPTRKRTRARGSRRGVAAARRRPRPWPAGAGRRSPGGGDTRTRRTSRGSACRRCRAT
jgi:hypothetical protein